jgi:transketolase
MLNQNLQLNDSIFTTDVEKKATRDGFGDALLELGAKDKNVVVLCADLADSTKTGTFKQKFPKQFVEAGIAEQNMAGVAAGMTLEGKVPFITSLAIFSPGRNWEQIRLSICMMKANVKIVGSHSGLSSCFDGGTAQALEDIALMRVLPGMTVLCPCDYWETKKATLAAAEMKGPVYLRMERPAAPIITSPETPFKIGKAQVFVESEKAIATIIATGPVLYEALVAAKELRAKHNVDVEVINVSTIKPLDEKTILESVKKTKHVVTVENHQIAGGLGGTVAELFGEKLPVPMVRIGVKDSFGESGTYEELKDKYGLSAHSIINAVLSLK